MQQDEHIGLISFALFNRKYGLAVNHVLGVLRVSYFAHLPRCPDFIVGCVNWHGSMVGVVDISQWWHETKQLEQKKYWVIMVEFDKQQFGLLAEEVLDRALMDETEVIDIESLSANLVQQIRQVV